jgi:hypothetical protein
MRLHTLLSTHKNEYKMRQLKKMESFDLYNGESEIISISEPIIMHPYNGRQIRTNISWHDSLEDAYFLAMSGKTLVVNSAGMEEYMSTEDDLCIRTNLCKAIENAKVDWPLRGKVRGIYSSDVSILLDRNYNLLRSPFTSIDVVSLFSRHISSIRNRQEMNELYTNIFQTLFHVVNEHPEITNLVFIPIGCMLFGHDPNTVASFFNNYLGRFSFGNISNIIISCRDNKNNYDAFSYHMIK